MALAIEVPDFPRLSRTAAAAKEYCPHSSDDTDRILLTSDLWRTGMLLCHESKMHSARTKPSQSHDDHVCTPPGRKRNTKRSNTLPPHHPTF
jgi:hypothetical protein